MSAVLSIDNWKSEAARLSYRNQSFIAGKYVAAASGKTFDCVNPANGQVLTQVAAGEAEDVDRAVKAGRAAFENSNTLRISRTSGSDQSSSFDRIILAIHKVLNAT